MTPRPRVSVKVVDAVLVAVAVGIVLAYAAYLAWMLTVEGQGRW